MQQHPPGKDTSNSTDSLGHFFTQSDINVVAEVELGELLAAGRSLKAA